MPDNVDESFDHFDEGLPVNPLPAPEVRRRGNRLRRRNTVLATVGGVAAVAVFVGVPVAVVTGGDGDDNGQLAPSPTATDPTPTPTPTESAPANPLLDFPLALGYPETHGSDGSPVKVTKKPGVGVIQLCGEVAWDPAAGTSALIGTEYVGEAEDWRARTLALYSSEEEATQYVTSLADAVAACPSESSDDESGAETLYDIQDSTSSSAQQWVIWTARYTDPEGRVGTGLTVFHLVRVGDLVLASYESGEGAGSSESMAMSIEHATDQAEAIAELMATELETESSQSASAVTSTGPTSVLGPDGVGKLRLGMTPEEVADTGEAASQQGSSHDGWRPGCHVLEFTPGLYGENDVYDGRVSLRVGLEEIVATADMLTPEGVGIGSIMEEVNAAYGVDKGPYDLLIVRANPDATYRIQLGGSAVTSMTLTLDDADCEI